MQSSEIAICRIYWNLKSPFIWDLNHSWLIFSEYHIYIYIYIYIYIERKKEREREKEKVRQGEKVRQREKEWERKRNREREPLVTLIIKWRLGQLSLVKIILKIGSVKSGLVISGSFRYILHFGQMNRVFASGTGDRGSISSLKKVYLIPLCLTLSIIR